MKLTIAQAAARLGKSERQIRYLIKTERLTAHKQGNRWMIDAKELPLTKGAQAAKERRKDQLEAAVRDALDLGDRSSRRRYSLTDLRAFKVRAPIFRDTRAALGAEHPAVAAMHRGLGLLARGCHRFERRAKVEAYTAARDELSVAAFELTISEHASADALRERVEQELLGAIAGLLNRVDKRARA